MFKQLALAAALSAATVGGASAGTVTLDFSADVSFKFFDRSFYEPGTLADDAFDFDTITGTITIETDAAAIDTGFGPGTFDTGSVTIDQLPAFSQDFRIELSDNIPVFGADPTPTIEDGLRLTNDVFVDTGFGFEELAPGRRDVVSLSLRGGSGALASNSLSDPIDFSLFTEGFLTIADQTVTATAFGIMLDQTAIEFQITNLSVVGAEVPLPGAALLMVPAGLLLTRRRG